MSDFEIVVWSFETKTIRNRFLSKTKIIKIKGVELPVCPEQSSLSSNRSKQTIDIPGKELIDLERKTTGYQIKKKFYKKQNEHNNIFENCNRNDTYLENFTKNKDNYFKLARGRKRDTGLFTYSKTVQQIDNYNQYQNSVRNLKKQAQNDLLWVITKNRAILLNEESLKTLADESIFENKEISSFEFLGFEIKDITLHTEESEQPGIDYRNPYKTRLNRETFYLQRNRGDFMNRDYYLDSTNRYQGYNLINQGPNLMRDLMSQNHERNKENFSPNVNSRNSDAFSKIGKNILTEKQKFKVKQVDVINDFDNKQIRHKIMFTLKKSKTEIVIAELVFDIGRMYEAKLASERLINILSHQKTSKNVKSLHRINCKTVLLENEDDELCGVNPEGKGQGVLFDRGIQAVRLFDLSNGDCNLFVRTGCHREIVIHKSCQ